MTTREEVRQAEAFAEQQRKDLAPLIPKPGSQEALRLGCRCPVIDNAHGNGHAGKEGVFVVAAECPVHG